MPLINSLIFFFGKFSDKYHVVMKKLEKDREEQVAFYAFLSATLGINKNHESN